MPRESFWLTKEVQGNQTGGKEDAREPLWAFWGLLGGSLETAWEATENCIRKNVPKLGNFVYFFGTDFFDLFLILKILLWRIPKVH